MEEKPVGEITVKVGENKPVEVSISGSLSGKHIPLAKRGITRAYLNWVKSRRKK